jgi:membrane-associated phospholipid phosphatase
MRAGVRLPALAALVCGTALIVLLGAAYAVAPLARLDALALHGLQALNGPAATPLCTAIAHSADPLWLALTLAALMAMGWAAGRRRAALAAGLAVVSANVATQVLKIVLSHPRFHPLLGTHQIDAAAFPSGHATAAMSIALGAVIVSPPRLRLTVAPIAAAYALAVCVSVLVLAWHFPSDVLGGMLVAAGFTFASVAAVRAIAGRRSDATPGHSLQIPAISRQLLIGGATLAAVVLLARVDDLVAFARAHTGGAAVLAALVGACTALLAGASLIADR